MKINRDVTEAQEKLKNAPTAVRMNIVSRLEQIPPEAGKLSDQKNAAREERQKYSGKLDKNLASRDKMNAYLDYETYKADPGSKLKDHVEKNIPEILRQIKNYENEIDSVPDYAFVQRLEMGQHLQKLKDEYKKQAYASLEVFFQKFEIWEQEIERCDKVISDCDRQIDLLAETESSLKLLKERVTSDASFDHISDDPAHPEWKEIVAPYFDAKDALSQAKLRRDSSAEYKQYQKIGSIFEQLKPESVFKSVYQQAYLPEIEWNRSDKNQFHFELFLKLHFCQRYFGPIKSRMFINIDEGKTIYPAEYQLLRAFLPEDSIFNVYGDINQKTDFTIGVRSWGEISKQWDIFQLNENYRNTKQITTFCNTQFHAGLIPIGIEGPDVEHYDLGLAVSKIMARYYKEPKERYAIIWDGSKENKNLIEKCVRGYKNVFWNFSAEPGVYVLSAHNSRGLEFENVLVFDKDMSFGAKYIAYTRSLNKLIIASEAQTNKEVKTDGMMNKDEFVRRVTVQSETIDQYIRDGKLIPDVEISGENNQNQIYFTEETLQTAAKKFGWRLIDDSNRKEIFMQMVQEMNMSASYKPVLLKAFFETALFNGVARISDIVTYFRLFYEDRKSGGLVVEKEGSIFTNDSYTDNEIKQLILRNPYKRFEDMGMMSYDTSLGLVKMDKTVWKKLTDTEKSDILRICDEALKRYFSRNLK